MSAVGWLDEVRARPVRDLAVALGIVVARDGFACPVPSCAAEVRGRADRRPAAGVRSDGLGWRCHRCGASGDGVALAALVTVGRVPVKGDADGWRALRSALTSRGFLDLIEAQKRRAVGTSALRPPAGEVAVLWSACGPVDRDDEVAGWLRDRGLEPSTVARLDLARALPVDVEAPPWLAPWARRRRAVLPVWSSSGALASLRFRAIGPVRGPKATGPSGKDDPRTGGAPYATGGAVLACHIARALLAGDGALDEWDRRIVVVEGEPDYLTWATRSSGEAERFAVFGVGSGWWSAEVAARVPSGAVVILRTHDDEAGERYAVDVRRSLAKRCRVLRAVAVGVSVVS